jgi:hypothetical protein
MTKDTTMRTGLASHDDWCIDEDTRHAVVARRNVLAALWAGSLMGMHGRALEQYAREVHSADFEVPGDSDVVAKLSRDLVAAGLSGEAVAVRDRLADFLKQAWRECSATD